MDFENEPIVAVRLDGTVQEYHDRVPGQLMNRLGENEVRHATAGAKHYFAAHHNQRTALEEQVRALVAHGDWLMVDISDRVRNHLDTPPFTNFFRPGHAMRIAAGDIIVLSGFSMNSFAELAQKQGLGVSWSHNGTELPNIRYSATDDTRFLPGLDAAVIDQFIGQWFWEIILYSFMALESFVAMRVHGFSPAAIEQARRKRDDWKARNKGKRRPPIAQLHPSTVKAIHKKRGNKP